MDPLEILTNKESIMPFYQPIFSADDQEIIGYEILGRMKVEQDFRSIGSFFDDESVPDEYRIEIDDFLTKKALNEVYKLEEIMIFINRNPNLLMFDRGESLLELLLFFKEKGLDLKRIVLEITEHNFRGDIEQLNHVLTYLRTYGIKIAIDNVGKVGSNLDRLRLLNPDILKVDISLLRQATTAQSYSDILYSLSLLARKVGSVLLYEDIEMLFQLQYAWRNGGRYFQGYYLARPSEKLFDKEHRKNLLKNEFQGFISHEKRKLSAQYEICNELTMRMNQLNTKLKTKDYDQILYYVSHEFSEESFRIYICDGEGFQQSANLHKNNDNEWTLQAEYKNKNWSWRPYFLENIVRMNYEKRGILSDLYSDIETGEVTRTFSFPLSEQLYIFIDLSYNFLFEQENLL
ncbi:MAG TPA: EAL domain-containing protein [Bacillus bacterium]|nr:EAL domain-containing protein [Bacillus sp. (in: firmicutes)]